MNLMVIDDALAAKLHQLDGPTKLVDAAGRVVAVVEPRADPALYDLVGDDLSPEEIERRCQPGRKRYTAEELIAKLRKLA